MKLHALRPVVAMAVRNRAPLPLVVLGISLISRAMAPTHVVWDGSELQAMFALVVYGALVPVLVIAVASSWLRGDDAPWAWALARPVTRTRWLRATLLVDVVTLALCLGVARWIVGPLPSLWLGGWRGALERELGYGALLVAVYATAAFAGTRGASAIGAAFYVAVLGAATMCTDFAASWVAHTHMFDHYPSSSLFELPSVATSTFLALFAGLAVRRAALGLPARPRIQEPIGLAAMAVALAIGFPWVLATAVRWFLA